MLIKEGSLYPMLHSLKKDGLVKTTDVQVGNRTRKYYSLTEKGNSYVLESVKELRDFMQTLKLILNPQLSIT